MAEKEDSSSGEEDSSSGRWKRAAPKTRCVCVTPPSPASGRGSRRPAADDANTGNPTFGRRMMLWGRHGFHLAILPSGRVKGVDDENNKHAVLEFSSAGVGEVRMKGVESNLYLAMNKDGKLYGEPDPTNDATVFVEAFLTQYNTYLSRQWAHVGWYVGIKKDGKIKPGHKTRWGQKAIQFLPRRRS